MRKPNKNKMAGVNSRFASVSESEILKIQEDAVPENTKKATKFGMKVFIVRGDLIFANQCFTVHYFRCNVIIAKIKNATIFTEKICVIKSNFIL